MNTRSKFEVENIGDAPRRVRVNGENIILRKGDIYCTDFPPKDKNIWKVTEMNEESYVESVKKKSKKKRSELELKEE